MRYGAAYMLAALSGEVPTVKDIENVLGSVGIDCDAAKAEFVVKALADKDIDELIAEGMTKIGGLMSGGGGGGGGAAAGGSAAAPAAEEAKAEEKKVEEEEESDDDMGFGLFD